MSAERRSRVSPLYATRSSIQRSRLEELSYLLLCPLPLLYRQNIEQNAIHLSLRGLPWYIQMKSVNQLDNDEACRDGIAEQTRKLGRQIVTVIKLNKKQNDAQIVGSEKHAL